MAKDRVSGWLRYSREDWSQTRLRGRRRFALVSGALIWGGLMSIGFVWLPFIFRRPFSLFSILVGAGMLLYLGVAGYWCGLKAFDQHEKEFLGSNTVNPPDSNPDTPSEPI